MSINADNYLMSIYEYIRISLTREYLNDNNMYNTDIRLEKTHQRFLSS